MIEKYKYKLVDNTITNDGLEVLSLWVSDNNRLTKRNLIDEFERKWANWNISKNSYFVNSRNVLVGTSQRYIRTSEVDYLCGDSKKAQRILKWKPKTSFKELIQLMMISDLKNLTHID